LIFNTHQTNVHGNWLSGARRCCQQWWRAPLSECLPFFCPFPPPQFQEIGFFHLLGFPAPLTSPSKGPRQSPTGIFSYLSPVSGKESGAFYSLFLRPTENASPFFRERCGHVDFFFLFVIWPSSLLVKALVFLSLSCISGWDFSKTSDRVNGSCQHHPFFFFFVSVSPFWFCQSVSIRNGCSPPPY